MAVQSACCAARCSCCWSLLFLQFAIAELYQRLLAMGQKVSNETTVNFCVRAAVTEGTGWGFKQTNSPYDTPQCALTRLVVVGKGVGVGMHAGRYLHC